MTKSNTRKNSIIIKLSKQNNNYMSLLQTVKHALLLTLWWLPRIFSILFALFLGVFSFDIFGKSLGPWKAGWLFTIHNIPTIIIVVILILSWKRSWLGGVSFILLGIIFFFLQPDKGNSLFTIVPLLIIGMLFLLNWSLRSEIKKAKTE